MRKKLSIFAAIVLWFSVIMQFYLIIENRTASVAETIIRFFSFYTILTNILTAVYFTMRAFKVNRFNKPGTLSAITVYITIVGAVYQVLLRHLWQPTGLQMIVDELLHTINPILVIIYWYLYEEKQLVKYRQIISWLVYPLAYLVFILARGAFSNFYPYPFVDVKGIGFLRTLINSGLLLLFFTAISAIFIFVGKQVAGKSAVQT